MLKDYPEILKDSLAKDELSNLKYLKKMAIQSKVRTGDDLLKIKNSNAKIKYVYGHYMLPDIKFYKCLTKMKYNKKSCKCCEIISISALEIIKNAIIATNSNPKIFFFGDGPSGSQYAKLFGKYNFSII